MTPEQQSDGIHAMKCKDIPDRPILEFLAQRQGIQNTWFLGYEGDVRIAMPKDTPDKLILGKMRILIRSGLVDGCACGCRGDFEITEKGQFWFSSNKPCG